MKNQCNVIKQKTTQWKQKQNIKTKKREENTSKHLFAPVNNSPNQNCDSFIEVETVHTVNKIMNLK